MGFLRIQAWSSIRAAGPNWEDGRVGNQSTCLESMLWTYPGFRWINLVTVEGSESLVMRNDTSNVDEAGEMKRTLSFSPGGITETLYTVKQDVTCKRYYTRNGR